MINREPCFSGSSPLNRERLYSFLVLFVLLGITFFPIISGKNFIPFEKFPPWSSILTQGSGQKLQAESPALKRLKMMPWAEDAEFGSIGINWAENLYFAHELKHGRLPLWDPYTGGGVPTLDSGQSRPFNPFRLPFYFFPTNWVYSLTMVLGLVFGGIGEYLWLSKRKLSPAAVVIGTGLFVLNPWVLDRLVLTDSAAYFVFPWCLLMLEQSVWGCWPTIARTVLCFVLMGHSGHPEVSMIMASVAAIVYLLSKNGPGDSRESFFKKTKTVGVVATFTLTCLTVLWLPLLKLLSHGYLYKHHPMYVFDYHWKVLTILPSDMFIIPAISIIFVCAFFTSKRLPRVWVTLLAIVIFLLFPMPWVGNLPSRLLSSLGLPPLYLKGVFWASLSFLAPHGLDAYQTSKKGRAMAAFAVGIAMLTVSGWQFFSLPIARNDITAFPTTAFSLLAMGPLALMVLRTVRGRIAPLIISATLLTPLAFPLSLNKLMWNTVDFKTNLFVEWLKTNEPNARSASIYVRESFIIAPNLGQAYGVRCIEIAAAIFLNHYHSMFHDPRTTPTTIFFDFLNIKAFRQMGAKIVLLPGNVLASGMDLLTKNTWFSVYSIPGAHGRLYFAERCCHYKPGTPFLSQIFSLSRETDAVGVVEDMGNPVSAVIPEVPSERGKAVFERDDTHEILIQTDCPFEGLLVLRDSWYPGWRVFIDGKRTPVLRINGCFRGVIVPPGRHVVRYTYCPILVYIGGGVSLFASLLVTVFSLRKSTTDGSRRSAVIHP